MDPAHIQFLVKNRAYVLGGMVGILVILGGVFLFNSDFFGEPTIEVLSSSDSAFEALGSEIVVEISGAIIKPGVYRLSAGSRMDDLLVAAGGLAVVADREYVSRNINRAAKLLDGQKIYVPEVGEVDGQGNEQSSHRNGKGSGGSVGVNTLININTASLSQLDKLPGIGSVRAGAIINGRPYLSVDELVSKKILPKSVFEKIRDQIGV